MKFGDPTKTLAMQKIMEWEGFVPTTYRDSVGVLTIGYGRTHDVEEGDVTTPEKEAKWMSSYVDNVMLGMYRRGLDELSPNEAAAVTSLIFNVGEAAFYKSNAYQALINGDKDAFMYEAFDAQAGFTKGTENGKKTVIEGLVNRRAGERDLFLKTFKE